MRWRSSWYTRETLSERSSGAVARTDVVTGRKDTAAAGRAQPRSSILVYRCGISEPTVDSSPLNRSDRRPPRQEPRMRTPGPRRPLRPRLLAGLVTGVHFLLG